MSTERRSGLSRRRLLQTASIASAALALGRGIRPARATPLAVEKEDLKLGFIKLTDMAPLAIAKELGYFEEEGLYVTLEAQANWKVLLDRVITGELDGAHMLAGQPIGATIGFGTKAQVIAPLSLDLNGNGITVSKAVRECRNQAGVRASSSTPTHQKRSLKTSRRISPTAAVPSTPPTRKMMIDFFMIRQSSVVSHHAVIAP